MPTPVPPEDYPEGSIAAILRDDGWFSIFLELSANVFVHTDVPRLLNMEKEYTVFAPTDEAFAAIPPELLDLMWSDPEVAEEMFFHHHVPERNLRSEDFELLKTWPTGLTPRTVEIKSTEDGFIYDGVPILEVDIEALNGVIHVLSALARIEILTD